MNFKFFGGMRLSLMQGNLRFFDHQKLKLLSIG